MFPILVLVMLASAAFHANAADPLPYASLLSRLVTETGVRWDRFGEEEKKLLAQALDTSAKETPSLRKTPDDQLAFWINAHNVCAMKLIADRLPLTDVMKISGFRDMLKCAVAGQERSLIDIQSGVIRPMFAEPRTTFALWWGVKGGPRLLGFPYDGPVLKKQLADQTARALKDPSFVNVSDPSGKILVSPLFDWYYRRFSHQRSL